MYHRYEIDSYNYTVQIQFNSVHVSMQLSFPVVGSLNGVHWFTDNAKASLLSCKSGDVKVVWKNFHEWSVIIMNIFKIS